MILGFNKRFPQPILDKIKKHTIREDKHNRWKAEGIIHMATGVRTKNYNCFYKCKCTGTQIIEIANTPGYPRAVWIDNRLIDTDEITKLAHNDGFKSIDDFFEWFNKDFQGKIIHWTDFRY